MNATTIYGALQTIPDIWIQVPGAQLDFPHYVHEPIRVTGRLDSPPPPSTDYIMFEVLPEITENKAATYNDESILGRSSPIKTFAHGDNRVITMTLNFVATHSHDFIRYRQYLFAIAAATHPRYQDGYAPPPICKIKVGGILGSYEEGVSAVLRNYDFNTDNTAFWWDRRNADANAQYMSMRFSINTNWDVVYSYESLPHFHDVLHGRF